ncbi:hypothetical protein B0H14DRAFT_3610755 [Mycena olivaceomarginata]|nr:hypothetical protein B0H14DRAFT_3610755 [Mycena olivaceomarginata]
MRGNTAAVRGSAASCPRSIVGVRGSVLSVYTEVLTPLNPLPVNANSAARQPFIGAAALHLHSALTFSPAVWLGSINCASIYVFLRNAVYEHSEYAQLKYAFPLPSKEIPRSAASVPVNAAALYRYRKLINRSSRRRLESGLGQGLAIFIPELVETCSMVGRKFVEVVILSIYTTLATTGGDYDRGLAHCGPKIATALAQCGFGRGLRRILTTFGGAELQEELGLWREALKAELKSNVSGHLDKRYPKLANEVDSSFPNVNVAELYMDPLTSWSSRFSGAVPETSQWIPREPHVDQVSSFCVAHFGWESILLDRLKANFWPGVASRMLFSRYLIYDTQRKVFAIPETNGKLKKIVSQGIVKESTPIAPLTLFRVRISISNFIQKAGLQPGEGNDYVLVTIPQSILAIAMRDLSLVSTDVTNFSSGQSWLSHSSSDKENRSFSLELEDVDDTLEIGGSDPDDTESGEMELVQIHRRLAEEGIIDLTDL